MAYRHLSYAEALNMESLKIARIAKFVALFGFVLPWLLVSCSGTTVATATGLQLAMGQMTMLTGGAGGHQSAPVLAIPLAFLTVIAGIFFSFQKPKDGEPLAKAKVMLATSVVAIFLCWLSLIWVEAGVRQQNRGSGGAPDVSSVIKVVPQGGYWLTVLSLVVAGGLASVALYRRENLGSDLLRRATTGLSGIMGAAGEGAAGSRSANDVKFWDEMADKSNGDLLQEYLFRFPEGKFAELARHRLAGQGIEPIVPPTSSNRAEPEPGRIPEAALDEGNENPEARASDHCPGCGGAIQEPSAKFCNNCGQPRGRGGVP